MAYSNIEMDSMLSSLGGLLERKDVIGYAAARNARVLRDELREYHERRNALIMEYGEPVLDEQGAETGNYQISRDSPQFGRFAEALERFAAIEHEPRLFKLCFDEAIGNLSGSELLSYEWMFEE